MSTAKTTTDAQIVEWSKVRKSLKARLITNNTEPWQQPKQPQELQEEQLQEQQHLDLKCLDGPYLVGGVDLSFVIGDMVTACAAYIVCELPSMEVVYEELRMVELTAPYVPGFLAFREAEPLARLIEDQKRHRPEMTPEVLLVDGNGLLHSDEFGLACHLGVLVDLPTIGVAKNLYQMNDLGLLRDEKHQQQIELLSKVGDSFNLLGDGNRILGVALKNCLAAKKPVFVSIGHRINLSTAMEVVSKCSVFRVPEPIRQADMRSREYLRLRSNRTKIENQPGSPENLQV